jgi:hypothetical protein
MADDRSHFEIPADRIRTNPIRVRGRSKTFSRPNYSAHGDYLRERAAIYRDYVANAADFEAAESLFIQIRTPNDIPVRGERQRLKSAGLEIVALSSLDVNSATVQLNKSQLPNLESKIDRYATSAEHTGKSYMSVIEDMGPVPVEEKLAPEFLVADDEPIDCLLLFYSSLTDRERATVLFAVRSYLARRGAQLGEQRRLSNGVIAVEARLRPSEAREAGLAFSTLRQIAPDHVFFVQDSWRISALSSAIRVESPRISTAIAIVDSGISPACSGLAGTVSAVLPQLPPGAVAAMPDHGTFVASRVEFGDTLEQQLRSGVLHPLCPLIDVPVLGVDARGSPIGAHEGHLASAIDAVVPLLPESVRVLNLSLGTNSPVTDGSMSLVAQLLDKHAHERDLLIVTTAGNIRDLGLLAGFPASLQSSLCRIDSPGDSLLAITVGSIAKSVEAGALSRANELSAFSRRGPGPFGGVKPDVVAHGGNCMRDGSTLASIATHGLLPSGQAWACDFGTSFAAPLISAMAAQLFDFYSFASANLVRALLLHFTTPVICPDLGVQKEHLIGLGEPSLLAALEATPHSAAFLHSGELTSNAFTNVPFFVPDCLSPGGDAKLRIRATVAIDPPVNPDNHAEYSKARVSVALRKPAEVGHSRVGVSDDVVDSDKWWPLSQLDRVFHRSYAAGEWELQLRLWTRDLPADYRQKFAVVIEVIDDSATSPVYADVAARSGTSYSPVAHRSAA